MKVLQSHTHTNKPNKHEGTITDGLPSKVNTCKKKITRNQPEMSKQKNDKANICAHNKHNEQTGNTLTDKHK